MQAWYLPAAKDIPATYFSTGTRYDEFKAKYGAPGSGGWEMLKVSPRQRVWMRQQLMERARHYRGMNVVGGALMGVACGLATYSIADPRAMLFAIIAVTALVGFHVAGLNKRLDALIQLLDHDP